MKKSIPHESDRNYILVVNYPGTPMTSQRADTTLLCLVQYATLQQKRFVNGSRLDMVFWTLC